MLVGILLSGYSRHNSIATCGRCFVVNAFGRCRSIIVLEHQRVVRATREGAQGVVSEESKTQRVEEYVYCCNSCIITASRLGRLGGVSQIRIALSSCVGTPSSGDNIDYCQYLALCSGRNDVPQRQTEHGANNVAHNNIHSVIAISSCVICRYSDY